MSYRVQVIEREPPANWSGVWNWTSPSLGEAVHNLWLHSPHMVLPGAWPEPPGNDYDDAPGPMHAAAQIKRHASVAMACVLIDNAF